MGHTDDGRADLAMLGGLISTTAGVIAHTNDHLEHTNDIVSDA